MEESGEVVCFDVPFNLSAGGGEEPVVCRLL